MADRCVIPVNKSPLAGAGKSIYDFTYRQYCANISAGSARVLIRLKIQEIQ
jgi:hypothetical protein